MTNVESQMTNPEGSTNEESPSTHEQRPGGHQERTAGHVRAALTVGAIQPGNNFRVVAGSHAEVADRVKALSFDAEARLYYDRNNDEIYDPFSGLEPAMDQRAGHRGMKASPELEVWRTLHLEVDSMGPVQGNTVHATSGEVTDNGDGTFWVPVNVTLDVNRFEDGWLQDGQGYFYPILGNTAWEVHVQQSLNPEPPMSNAGVWLWDDDQLRDGQDVPMPDTSELGNAMAEAYVQVLEDVGDGNDAVPFHLNLETRAERVGARDWDSQAQNSAGFWVAYVLGAFQHEKGADNDPASESAILGVTLLPEGGSLVFEETIRDVAAERNWDAIVALQDTVVHEVAHAVGNILGDDPPITRWEEGVPSRYTEPTLRAIRATSKPAG